MVIFNLGIVEVAHPSLTDWARNGSLEGELCVTYEGQDINAPQGGHLTHTCVWVSRKREAVCLLAVRREVGAADGAGLAAPLVVEGAHLERAQLENNF